MWKTMLNNLSPWHGFSTHASDLHGLKTRVTAILSFLLLSATAFAQATQPVAFEVYPPAINLESARDFSQIIVMARQPDGITRDVTAEAQFALPADPAIATIEGHSIRPAADGTGNLTVTYSGQSVTVPLTVKNAAVTPPVSFKLDVMPVFMRVGCNSGSCHGSARGQDGFQLSLFGYDPDGDYQRITREIATRRINLAQPNESLMIKKSLGTVPHTGGKRIEENSHLHKTLVDWLSAGASADPADIPTPVSLEILPKQIVLEGEGATQQMMAIAKYSDGTDRDVTNLALFLTNNDNSATISVDGLVTAANRGEAFVMARFATFTVGSQAIVIPKGLQYAWPGPTENNYIDTLVNDKLKKLRVIPSELCTDEAFLRRAFIDITGTLPTREDYDKFIASADPKKRELLVDELLGRKEFVEMWVMKFAELLKIRSQEPVISYKSALLYYNWLQDKLANNVPMNVIVRELLSANGGTFKNAATNYYQLEPDTLKLTEDTAQVFMGMRLQCAQCHNHPFDRWTMDDYYSFSAFFTQIGRKAGEDPREQIIFNSSSGEATNPVTKATVAPKFLGGATPDVAGKDRREVLANWLASPENPYFARNLANIVWAHFFGQGIIEPVDDVRISNPPINPELLDELARKFTEYNYDFKRLVRDICTSRTYQLATQTNETNAQDTRNFAHGAIRRLRAEVMLDTISQVTEAPEKFQGLPLGARAVQVADGTTSNYFLTTFGRASRQTVCSDEVNMNPSLSQALHLLNGETVSGKIESGGVVKKLLEAQTPTPQIVENLYLRCLMRKPTEKEQQAVAALLAEPNADANAILNDLFWALLNSQEFIFNH